MANSTSLPLHERIPRKNTLKRAADVIILFFLISLLCYRFLYLSTHGIVWLLALLCESWFTFMWLLMMNFKWNPIDYRTYPDRLLNRWKELPPVDMFVTTADCTLEPPIGTVNTVLSLLAVDYPAHKLACYVSDDGCSPFTFYSLFEASKFANIWVPFCKKYSIRVRAPFMYFSSEPEIPSGYSSEDFMDEWRKMKRAYEELSQKIDCAVEKSAPYHRMDEFADFLNIERGNHPSIVKVIWENKDNQPHGIPHLIYVAREKRPKQHHRFKAGAMNVLARVSGVMTNAPFMLNVDCDMFANNPQVVLHAMSILLGCKTEKESGFVQFPQVFYGGLKDDPFGNHFAATNEYLLRGMGGMQGPLYAGTGCFHRRKIIYGQSPDCEESTPTNNTSKLNEEVLRQRFGQSSQLSKSIAKILSAVPQEIQTSQELSATLAAAEEVASCRYEFGTQWGKEVGWVYGSMTEDVLTGLKIHSMGWTSTYCTPNPPGFLGCAPMGGPACLTQLKRWATGLFEILFGKQSPLVATFTKRLTFRQCLAYLLANMWAPRSIPEFCYALLPAYCLLTNTSFLPKVSEPWILVAAGLFIFYNLYTLSEYLCLGLSIRNWWNNQRMQRITFLTASLFGSFGVVLKLLGISETIFEVTKKEQNAPNSADTDAGRFTFDSSPIFIPVTTLVLLHMVAVAVVLLGVQPLATDGSGSGSGSGLGEIICSLWLLFNFMPFVKGLFSRGCYGIPWSVIGKSGALVLLFMHSCTRT